MVIQNFLDRNWVYSLADYRQIFALTDQDLQKTVLDFPGGISSVNAELYALGQSIVSADPAYCLSYEEMHVHAHQFLENKMAYLHGQPSADKVIAQWSKNVQLFLADYELGKKQGRYRVLEAPPFASVTQTFELLLCTDFLLNSSIPSAYSSQDIMNELCKIAVEIRIFPIADTKAAVSTELGPLMLAFQQRNFGVEVRAVHFPLRLHANAALRIWARECEVNNT